MQHWLHEQHVGQVIPQGCQPPEGILHREGDDGEGTIVTNATGFMAPVPLGEQPRYLPPVGNVGIGLDDADVIIGKAVGQRVGVHQQGQRNHSDTHLAW